MRITYSPQTRREILGFLALLPLEAWAADCSRDARALALTGQEPDAPQLRLYNCKVSETDGLTVQFNRLNDLLAGIVLSGKSPAALPDLTRNAEVFDNEVLREYQRLIGEYGYQRGLAEVTDLTTSSPEASLTTSPESLHMSRVQYAIGAMNDGRPDYPEAAALQAMTSGDVVPPGYTRLDQQNIFRPMVKSDIDNYEANVRRFNALIAKERSWYPSKPFRVDRVFPAMRLLRELASAGLPSDFSFVFGFNDRGMACGQSKQAWEFRYSLRDLLLEVAVVANTSNRPLRLDGLLGRKSDGKRLRLPQPANVQGDAQELARVGKVLPPTGRLIIPTKIIWSISDGLIDTLARDRRKRPVTPHYLWGPEWQIDGLRVQSQSVFLEGRAANFLAVTSSCGCGSCPYLLVWDDEIHDWVDTGKILEDADHPSALTTDWRRFGGLVLRYRLAEVEAEVAVIDAISLRLNLRSGGSVLATSLWDGRDTPGTPFRLEFNDQIDLDFAVPTGLHHGDVESSEFFISGYYERYRDIISNHREERSPYPTSALDVT